MTIKRTYVGFEQAKLLKEKGLDILTLNWYHKDTKKFNTNSLIASINTITDHYSAPEQWQVVEWLRTEYKMELNFSRIPPEAVQASVQASNLNTIKNYVIWIWKEDLNPRGVNKNFHGDTPQEAYSAAFDYILNNLI